MSGIGWMAAFLATVGLVVVAAMAMRRVARSAHETLVKARSALRQIPRALSMTFRIVRAPFRAVFTVLGLLRRGRSRRRQPSQPREKRAAGGRKRTWALALAIVLIGLANRRSSS